MKSCLFALVLFLNYVAIIMPKLDVVSLWRHNFRHYAHKAALYTSQLHVIYMYLYYYSYISLFLQLF